MPTKTQGGSIYQASDEYTCRPQIKLLEFDERFAVFKEFEQYDFQNPIKLPPELKASFDRIIVDPPFLSQDCQTKGSSCFPSHLSLLSLYWIFRSSLCESTCV
jgi:hypothetical protein